jgi:hypothetical protein
MMLPRKSLALAILFTAAVAGAQSASTPPAATTSDTNRSGATGMAPKPAPVGAAKAVSHSNTNNNRTAGTATSPEIVGAAKVKSHSNTNNNRTEAPTAPPATDSTPPHN